MKKKVLFWALILLILSIMTGTVVADYDPVTPNPVKQSIPHTMTLTKSDTLDYTITYKFAAESPQVFTPNGLNPSDVISGTPTITGVTYGPEDNYQDPNDPDKDYFADDRSVTKNVEVNWTGVTFSEPGVFYWEVKKTLEDNTPADEGPSNNYGVKTTGDADLFLYAYVINNDQGLVVSSVGLTDDRNFKDPKPTLTDSYPATLVDLSVKKIVSGNQGSKDQYFQFDFIITPGGTATRDYKVGGFDSADVVNQSPYNTGATQPQTIDGKITLVGGSENNITVWLKHGQTFKIEGLPFGSYYSVTETAASAAGYETKYTITGDTTNIQSNDLVINWDEVTPTSGVTVTDKELKASTTVTVENIRNITPPTGIELENGAPFIGVILAMILLGFVFVPNRREERL